MNSPGLLFRIHHRIAGLANRLRLEYYRRVLGAPTLELYFPFYIQPLEKVKFGERVAVGAFVHIVANGGVSIGNNTMIASSVQITSSTHDYRLMPFRDHRLDAPVTIGHNVWIGADAVILPGITIGDNSVVGAGSVVTKDVPPSTVVAGAPARVIRHLAAAEPAQSAPPDPTNGQGCR
jgi:acetyltransferase-like isoleucine patch superfamily enzyme